MHQYTLPKSERLYLRESISELFANGSSFTAFPYRVVYLIKSEQGASCPEPVASSPELTTASLDIPAASENPAVQAVNERQGRCAIMAIAPKKRFKHAVDRNRVKRLIRESYRLQKLPLIAQLEASHKQMKLAFLYVDNKHITFEESFATIGRAINRLIKAVAKS